MRFEVSSKSGPCTTSPLKGRVKIFSEVVFIHSRCVTCSKWWSAHTQFVATSCHWQLAQLAVGLSGLSADRSLPHYNLWSWGQSLWSTGLSQPVMAASQWTWLTTRLGLNSASDQQMPLWRQYRGDLQQLFLIVIFWLHNLTCICCLFRKLLKLPVDSSEVKDYGWQK